MLRTVIEQHHAPRPSVNPVSPSARMSATQIVVSFLIVVVCSSASDCLAHKPKAAVTTHIRGILDPLGALWAPLHRVVVRITPRHLR
jgi:hypothetical protein